MYTRRLVAGWKRDMVRVSWSGREALRLRAVCLGVFLRLDRGGGRQQAEYLRCGEEGEVVHPHSAGRPVRVAGRLDEVAGQAVAAQLLGDRGGVLPAQEQELDHGRASRL